MKQQSCSFGRCIMFVALFTSIVNIIALLRQTEQHYDAA